ncbi:MAG: hypothetical protein P4L49_05920 [Desulfosporosinus sp.]|nr:hypothetical protein [Desulfosporosinus sp.]
MFLYHNTKRKLSILVINLFVINVLAVQPVLALNSSLGNNAYSFQDYAANNKEIASVSAKLPIAQVTAATSALTAINGGTEVFADFTTAGVKKAVAGSKADYDTAIAAAKATKGSSLTLAEVQTQVEAANAAATASALIAINGGTEVFADFTTAGVTKAVAGNKADYDTAIAAAGETKGSSLTLEEVQTQVEAANAEAADSALTAINGGTEVFADFTTAGVKKAVALNKTSYDTAIAAAKATKGASLTLAEVQTQVEAANAAAAASALTAINGGTEVAADFATAGVKGAVAGNKVGYDTAIAAAKATKGSDLILAEVQTQVESVNAAAAASALIAINGGTEVIADFTTAGVTKVVAGNKASYDTAIAAAKAIKGSNLTLTEVQTQVEAANAAAIVSALTAINSGTEVFADFSTAGVKGAVAGNKAGYDTAIAAAKATKGSDLTLAEVQAQVESANIATLASTLATINGGAEAFADFAVAGVKGAVVKYKAGYDTAIATAEETKGSSLTLEEVQTQVEAVNAAGAASALTAINRGTEVFADFATAGVTNAVIGNKAGYNIAIAAVKWTKATGLTLEEVQTQVDEVNVAAAASALTAINGGTEAFEDFTIAGVKGAVVKNRSGFSGYDAVLAAAKKKKGSSLTLAEVQTQIEAVNAGATTDALTTINRRTDVFADFAVAGVKGAVVRNKANYDKAIATAKGIKGCDLTLAEVQTQIEAVNTEAAVTALSVINRGSEAFADFSLAGVKNAVIGRKTGYAGYDTAIASAIKIKGSGLTLAEVQTQVEGVNAVIATNALTAINRGTEVFADFALAGVNGAVVQNKIAYDIAIAKKTTGSDLSLAEVQEQVAVVNAAVARH